MFKSGFVTIIGKPNAGKSTLLNQIIGHKISIATSKQNTTRNQIRGIYNDQDSQIVFLDTPGFLKAKTILDENMQKRIVDSLNGVDIILYLLPFWKELDNNYLKLISFNKTGSAKKYLLLSKVDKASNKADVFEAAAKFNDSDLFDKIIPISSHKDINIQSLIEEIKKDLKNDIAYYDKEDSHNNSDKFYISEIIREKALFNLQEEIPHHLFVFVDELKIKKGLISIRAEIVLDRDNLKRILIGKNGSMIKIIGQKAREELEQYFGRKVFLEIFVKIRKDWQNKDSIIKNI